MNLPSLIRVTLLLVENNLEKLIVLMIFKNTLSMKLGLR